MNKLFGFFAWFLILLSLGLNLAAFVSFPGLDWRHYLIVGSGGAAAAAFLIAYYVHQTKQNWLRVLYV